MKNFFLLFLLSLLAVSCGSRKSVSKKSQAKTYVLRDLTSHYSGRTSYTVEGILKESETFLGTPYQWGGQSRKGIDCSGLVVEVFRKNRFQFPRQSQDQAKQGRRVDIKDTRPGDLLFFDTSGEGKVNHVGIVRAIKNYGEVTFIHASTSKGVMISSLNERYWNKAFLFVRRVL